MTQVQVGQRFVEKSQSDHPQNVFIFADGGTKATMAELERRKFTAEEGVNLPFSMRY